MILLASVSIPGSLTLSSVPVVRALSVGKLFSGGEGAQIFEDQLCLLAEDECPKGPCPRSSVVSVTCVSSCVDQPQRDPGEKMAISLESCGLITPCK